MFKALQRNILRNGRTLMLLLGVALVFMSLYVTNRMARSLREKEKHDVELWAVAMERINRDALGDYTNDPLLDAIINNRNNIPFIITDENLKVLQVSNKRAGNYKSGDSFLEVKTDGSVYNRGKGGNYQEASISFDGLPQGENVIAFTADYTALTNGKWQLVYSVYLNGDLVNTYTDMDASGINYVRTGLGDSTLYYGEGLAAPSDMVILLPEPTALALLALGVAGVALRRRV